ncbi:MAG: ribosomal protein S18-alanine N-acetyltransferase [Gammaproteobacteria bacterium]|nr:ribosomal protein S18-alanine N-acetyltransferase [Gammaproteobacteria bacterium]MDH5592904.1 ribosomal protein S18-alanine N-acetyltransferase [Gammaproteobacteria bacterium]
MSAVLELSENIRPMNEDDLDKVMAIEPYAYEHPWTKGIFRDCLRVGYSCWVIENEQGGIDGYGVMSVGVGEAHILNLTVAPEMQKQGLGKMLLQHFIELARHHALDTMLLEVRPSNKAAVALYVNTGFNEAGVRKDYYPAKQGREDALILALSLIS